MNNNIIDENHENGALIPGGGGENSQRKVAIEKGAIIYEGVDLKKGKRHFFYIKESVIALLIIAIVCITLWVIKDPLFDYLKGRESLPEKVLEAASSIFASDYSDVPDDAWYAGAVERVTKEKLMSGKTKLTFGPRESVSRADFAEIIYKMEGKPKVKYNNEFGDVKKDAWYSLSVTWLHEMGIVVGSGGMFKPNATITYEEVASMLWKYSIYKGYCSASDYNDAIRWAISMELIKGKQGTDSINPKEEVNRAVCAVIITRFLDSVVK